MIDPSALRDSSAQSVGSFTPVSMPLVVTLLFAVALLPVIQTITLRQLSLLLWPEHSVRLVVGHRLHAGVPLTVGSVSSIEHGGTDTV